MPSSGKVLLVVVGVAAVVTLTAILATIIANKDSERDSKRTFTLEDYFNDTISYKVYNLRWISDNEYLHKTREGSVFLHNVNTRNATEFLNNKTFAQVDATDYLMSADRKYVCLESNYTNQWRHSFTASYSLYSLETSEFVSPSHIPEEVQYLLWAPVGNKLAYVWKYNIYIKDSAMSNAKQITKNGEKNKILNGIPDWVYEEEMFSSNDAMWWSPSGKYLAYVEFNDTEVHTIEYSWYGSGQYPETVAIPYPKAGSSIPKVKLFVADSTGTSGITQVVVPNSVGESDHYLSSVTWVTDKRIAVQWAKRSQNYVLMQTYDFDRRAWKAKSSHEETSKTGWVGHFSPLHPFFAEDNLSFYKVMSDSAGYKHIHYVNAGMVTPITSGQWEVIYISKLTEDAIYYVSNEYRKRPGQRNVYKIRIGDSHSAPECLTCGLQEDSCQYNSAYFSEDAAYYRLSCYGPGLPIFTLRDNRGSGSELEVLENNDALGKILTEFQMPTMRYGTLSIGGFDSIPPENISSVWTFGLPDGMFIAMMMESIHLMVHHSLPPLPSAFPLMVIYSSQCLLLIYVNIYIAEHMSRAAREREVERAEFDLQYQMMLPPHFDESKKYPLLIDVYAGPCSQSVNYKFKLNWGTYLASTEKVIVASFDGRGSGYQGDKIMHSIYHRLGTYEVEDQISAVRKFIDMGFIDTERIAIWGWSYGGYVTSMALGSGSGLFKCGVAVAPVSSWEYYDAVYTERYMSCPSDNAEYYKNSTVTRRAKNFKSVDYLLIHGTADDMSFYDQDPRGSYYFNTQPKKSIYLQNYNVHFQQAAQISKALVDEQVDFEAMWYTDKNHQLGGSAFRHVFTHISHFLQKCFGKTKRAGS